MQFATKYTPSYIKMNQREDLYSREAQLIDHAKRELADGLYKDPIHKLQLLYITRGAAGMVNLVRTFRNMDDNVNKAINLEEFINGVRDTGLDCSEEELREMFESFDEDNDGLVNLNEFLLALRPPISEQRLAIIEKAFNKIDKTDSGVITVADLKKVYSVGDNPKYLSGEMTKNELFTQFLNSFEGGRDNKDGTVTQEEFVNYYATISSSIDNDGYFDLVMRQAYKI